MPLRKRKGRGRAAVPDGRTKEDAVPEVHPKDRDAIEDGTTHPQSREEGEADAGASSSVSEDGAIDEEERRARETIALLAKKYQVKLADHSTNTLDIIRVDESEAAQLKAEEVGKENRGQPRSPLSSRRPGLVPQRQPKLKKPIRERDTTPVFKVPKPLTHHSTPAASGNRSLFGFEELDSPLTLSPVTTTTPSQAHSSLTVSQHTSEEEVSKVAKPSPYSRLKGTYDIPFKRKTPKRPPARRKKRTSDQDRWADNLNAQFVEVEEFELAVE